MISIETLILLLGVAALAFYAGMHFGRQQALIANRSSDDQSDDAPRAGRGSSPTPIATPQKPVAPRGAPPPASAGSSASAGANSSASADAGSSGAPRRSSAPPPASASLIEPGGKQKS